MHEKDLDTNATAGVIAEYCDSLGNVIAQEVFFDWCEAPIPNVGDLLTCAAPAAARHRPKVLVGKVRSRQFDVQRDDEGEPRVWVRLILEVRTARRSPPRRRRAEWCSLN